MAEKWRHLVEAFEDLMTLTGPIALGRASLAVDVAISVSVGAMGLAEADALKGSVRGRLLHWVIMTYQTLKL